MSGETSSAKDRLDAVDKVLDEYENALGLPSHQSPAEAAEINVYLSMNRDRIEKLSGEDCGQIAMRLMQYAFYLRRMRNREVARKGWANRILNDVVCAHPDYDKYKKHEVNMALVCRENSYAQKLGSILRYAEQRATRLDGMADDIKYMANTLENNRRAKS